MAISQEDAETAILQYGADMVNTELPLNQRHYAQGRYEEARLWFASQIEAEIFSGDVPEVEGDGPWIPE